MKNILKTLICSLIIMLFCRCKNSTIYKEEKPNILFILVDDQRNDVISSAGHPIVKTPTIDQLAKNGTVFTNAFVTTPICAASRASILTGLYESKHNYTFGKKPLKKEFITNSYPYLLKKSGYVTGFTGKFGVNIEIQDSMLTEMFDYFKPSLKNAAYFETMSDGTLKHSDEIRGDEAVEFIKNQTSKKPFCLSISFNSVHAVDKNLSPGIGHYPYPESVAKMYENIEMPKPKLSDPKIYDNHPDFLKNSLNRERYFWRWDTEEKYQTNMRAYFRMISGYDNIMNRVISTLKEKGLDKNTVIIYSADNGYYMGNRGFAGKWTHYDESLRVPLIIYDPRIPNKNSVKTSDKVALNIDIPATILDIAGISTPQRYQGKSLLPILNNDKIKAWRDNFLIEHRMEYDKLPKYVGIHEQRYVYVNYYEQNPPYEYLHDLQKDPDQLENLKSNPNYSKVLQNMRSKCDSLEYNMKNN
ncbi:sulfatase [Mariniflexile gromovii]|uniref:Sulfatase n=1 Tax=Mariniflexile gromovii TaxID=362523 RepID=A0ABS4BSE3_9FLAO|nr:sulfatase [Mariniflexile gromovii]MBP0902951.1 sulfatase [Mariniflexile gromovii]